MLKVHEDNFRDYHRQISGMKSRIMLGTAVLSVVSMYLANNYFYGRIVAKLPFEPWKMVANMSHRGLDEKSEDLTDVCAIFIYILLQMTLRGTIGKIFGYEGPRMPVDHQTPKWLQEYTK